MLFCFNPPYLPTQPEERINDWLEHALDGGLNGRVVIERFSEQVESCISSRWENFIADLIAYRVAGSPGSFF